MQVKLLLDYHGSLDVADCLLFPSLKLVPVLVVNLTSLDISRGDSADGRALFVILDGLGDLLLLRVVSIVITCRVERLLGFWTLSQSLVHVSSCTVDNTWLRDSIRPATTRNTGA